MKRWMLATSLVVVASTVTLGAGAAHAATTPWTSQIGTSWFEGVGGVAVSSCGNVVAAGHTMGTFPGKKKAGQADAFVVRYTSKGKQQWLREFGTTGNEQVTGVAIAPCGSIYVVGYTNGTFPKQTNAGGYDGFIAKFSTGGTRLWVRQFGTAADDMPRGIAVAPSGYVYVTGMTYGAFPLFMNAGSADGFLAKYSSGGTQKWVSQGGTSAYDEMTGVSVPRSNEIYVSGETRGAFPSLVNQGDVDGIVARFDSTGLLQWMNQFGTSSYDHAVGIAVTKTREVYVAGYTGGNLGGGGNAGEADAYLARFDGDTGANLWVNQWGTAADDDAAGVAISKDGVVVGGSTYGAFPTFANAGGADGYAAIFDSMGTNLLLRQFGTSADETVSGVAAGKYNGDPIVAGGTHGAFPGFTNAGNADAYVMDVESELGETT